MKKRLKKASDKMKYSVINLAANVPSYPRFTRHNRGWINYGEENNLPQRIIDHRKPKLWFSMIILTFIKTLPLVLIS